MESSLYLVYFLRILVTLLSPRLLAPRRLEGVEGGISDERLVPLVSLKGILIDIICLSIITGYYYSCSYYCVGLLVWLL